MSGHAQYYCCEHQHINVPHGRNALLLLRKPLSFKTALRLLREFSKTHAPPSSPHARPKYDRLMVVALLILKEVSPQPINFESIRGRAIEAEIDMRISGDAKHGVPTAETLRYHYRNPRLRQ